MKSARMLAFFASLCLSTSVYAVDVLVSSLLDDPDPAVRGGLITYTIEVENQQADLAKNVVLQFPVPATTTFEDVDNPNCTLIGPPPGIVECTYGDMWGTANEPPGPIETANILIRSSATTGAIIDVEATVTTDSDEENTENNVLGQNTTIDDGADLVTVFAPAAPDPVVAGGTVTYTNTVENLGPNDAQAVRLVFQLSVNVTYEPGSASGSGWTCSYDGGAREISCTRSSLASGATAPVVTWRARVTGAALGTLTNSAYVGALTGDPKPDNNIDTVDVEVVEGTDLAISVSASESEVLSGSAVTLTLSPRNLGPFDADNVVVTYVAPDDFVLGTPTGGGWSCSVLLQVVTCTRGLYTVGAADDITVPLTAPVVTAVTNYDHPADIITETAESNFANNKDSVRITVTPDGVDLRIRKNKFPNPVAEGSPITSRIRVNNDGPRDAAAGTITIVDELGPDEGYKDYSGSNWTCTGPAPDPVTGPVSGPVSCTYSNDVANGGATSWLTITTVANAGDVDLKNTATVYYSGDPGDYNDSNDEADRTVRATSKIADLVLSKSAVAGVAPDDDTDGDPTRLDADPGPPEKLENTIRYTLSIFNDGPDPAGGIVLRDPIPGRTPGTVVTMVSQPANYSCDTAVNPVRCTQADGTELAVDESDTFVIDVTRPLLSGLQRNRADAFSSKVGDDDRDNNNAEAEVTVEAVADVTVQDKNIVNENDEVKSGVEATYVITLRNNGPSAAENVQVIDTFVIPPGDPGFTFLSAADTGNGSGCAGMTPGSDYPGSGPAVLTCDLGGMAANSTETITVRIRPNYMASPPDPRTFDNSVTISTSTLDSDHENDAFGPVTLTIVQDEIDLLINNSDEPDPVAWDPANGGDNENNDVVYHVRYTNRGPSYATGVSFLYTMTPKDGKTVRFDCDETAGGDACGTSPDVCSIESGSNPVTGPASLVLACDASTVNGKADEMTAGSSGSRYLRFRVLSQPESTGDTHATIAAISANEYEPITGNNEELENTSVRARVDLEVVGKVPGEPVVQLDQPFNWTITVVNNGPLASDETILTDELPDGMILHGAEPSWANADDGTAGLCSLADRTLTCEFGAMSVDATTVVTVPVTIDVYTLATVENCVTATTNGVDVKPGNNEDVCGSIGVENTYFPSDFGDAPDTSPGTGPGDYATTLDHGGARHMLPGGTWLGDCVDSDGDGSQQNAGATADDDTAGPVQDGTCEAGDDEDGIDLPPALIAGRTMDIGIVVSGDTCALDAWIDYNADGDFTDPGEQLFNALSLAAGSHTQAITPPSDIAFGNTYARFRCSERGGLDSVEETYGGEVEDYLVSLQPDGDSPDTPTDYGDAPDASLGTGERDYETLSVDNGASHILGRPDAPYLGSCVDSDPQDQQGLTALADDDGAPGGAEVVIGSCTDGDDEDGVLFTAPLRQGSGIEAIEVTASSGTNDCTLSAWIDFNGNGDFTDLGEQVATDLVIAAGATVPLSPAVPSDAAVGLNYARFRCNSDGGLGPVGAAYDGEVEDYLVAIRPDLALLPVDFGDAPDTSSAEAVQDYTTVEANDGPSHVLVPGVSPFLGACVDSDDGTAQNLAADADDNTGALGVGLTLGTCATPGMDEDGVLLPPVIFQGGTLSLDLEVSPVAECVLNAWIDFNQDGSFNGPAEKIIDDQLQAAGTTQSWPFSVPADAVIGETYARFRCSSLSGLGPDGPGRDGEVEDYRIDVVAGVARFRVTKDFSDRNPVPVDVQLSCNAGLPLEQQFTISDSDDPSADVEFVVGNFESGLMDCQVTETPVPGYTGSYDNSLGSISATSCAYTGVERGTEHLCVITNTLAPVTVNIVKTWETMGAENGEIPLLADIMLECSNVAGGEDSWTWAIEGEQTVSASVLPLPDGETVCVVSESYASPYVAGSGCDDPIVVNVGDGEAGCELVNTVFFEGIPTLSEYGLAILALLTLGVGFAGVRRYA